MRCSRMCLLSTGRPVRRGHLRVQGHGWRAGSQGRGPAGARQDRRGTCGRPSVPGSSPRWHGGEACAGQEGGHAEVAAWDRQAPMAAVSSVSVVVHTETPARSAAVKLGTWCRVLCPVSQHVTWRGNPVRRVARKPRGAGGSPRWPCRARPAQPRPRGQRCQVCGHRCPSAHSSGVPMDALCSVGPSSCPLSPVRPTAQDVRAKVGTQDVHTHVTSHALSSAGGPEPLPGALGRPEAPRWRNLSPPRWALVAKLDSDSLRWCFGLIAC